MLKLRHIAVIAGAAMIATPALAQDAAKAPAQEQAPAAATPTAPAAVTDVEVAAFAKAALAADRVNKDAAVPAADKPKKLADVVAASGLDPNRFNQIAEATQSDAALQAKVQAAIAAEQQPAK